MIKRLLSAMVGISLALGITAADVFAESNETVYIDDDFESGNLTGWNIDKREGDCDIFYDEEEDNHYFASWGESITEYQKFPHNVKNFPSAVDRGILKVSLKARSSNPKGNCMFEVNNEVLWPAFQAVFRSAGTLTFNEYTVAEKFEVNRWYDIDIYMDLDRYVYDAYLDGEIVVKSGAFKTEGIKVLSAFQITGWFTDDEYAQIDIDDLKISDYTNQKKADEAAAKPYNETLSMLNKLGVIDDRSVIEFDGGKELTRAEYLRCLIGLSELDESRIESANEELFKDVPPQNEYARLVKWAYSRGIIQMNEQKLFYPDEPIKSTDAIVMLVRMAGYSPKVSNIGGYAEGYLKVAYEIELIEPGFDVNAVLTQNAMLELFKNALDVDVMKMYVGNKVTYSVTEGDTMSKVYKHLEKIEGVVTANSKTGIVNATGSKSNSLEIDKISYYCDNSQYDKYLGYYVEGYIDTDNDDALIYVCPSEKNRVKSLAKKEFTDISIDGNRIKYRLDGKGDSYLRVDKPYIIYNGKAYDGDLNDDLLNINNGMLTFISNDRDNVYDVILIDEAEHIIFSACDVINEIIYGTMGEKYFLDDDYKLYRNGDEISLSELKNNDVLSIRRTISNSAESYEITTLRNIKYGTICAIEEDRIKINDEYFDLSEEFKKYGITPKNGFSGAFYLDCDGNVLYFEDSLLSGSRKKTGYILRGCYNEDDDAYTIFYADFSGGHERKSLGENIIINGKKVAAKAVDGVLSQTGENSTVSQVFDFWENNDGAITKIATDEYECAFADAVRCLYNSGKTLFRDGETTAFIGKDTIVYQIPSDNPTNYDSYGRFSTMGYNEGTEFKVSAYNLNEINVADVVLIKEASKSFTINDARIFVTGVSDVVNRNGDAVKEIKAVLGGKSVTYLSSEYNELPALPFGTVMYVRANAKGEIVSHQLKNDLKNYRMQTTSGAYSDTQYCYGKIKSSNAEGCIITVNDDEYPYIYNTNFKVYLADVNKKTCTEITSSSIGAYRSEYSDAYVYTVGYRGGMSEMYIYVR